MVSANVSDEADDSSLLGYWKGTIEDGVNIDESGNGYNGTISAGLTVARNALGDALLFTGNQSDKVIADSDAVGLENGFTVETVAVPHQITGQLDIFATCVGNDRFVLAFIGGYVGLGVYNSAYPYIYLSGPSNKLAVGQPVHVVAIWDATTRSIKLYVDGEEQSGSVAIGSLPFAHYGYIGASADGGSSFLNGKVYYLKLYKEVKTEAWAQNKYTQWANQVVWSPSYNALIESGAIVAPTHIPNTPISLKTGTLTLGTEDVTINGKTKRCKVLTANSGSMGTILIPANKIGAIASYFGTIEYYAKNSPTNISYLPGPSDKRFNAILGEGANAICAYLHTTNGIRVYQIANGSGYRTSAYYTDFTFDAWNKYTIKIRATRTVDLYVNDTFAASLNNTDALSVQSLGFSLGGGTKILLASEDGEWNMKKYIGV